MHVSLLNVSKVCFMPILSLYIMLIITDQMRQLSLEKASTVATQSSAMNNEFPLLNTDNLEPRDAGILKEQLQEETLEIKEKFIYLRQDMYHWLTENNFKGTNLHFYIREYSTHVAEELLKCDSSTSPFEHVICENTTFFNYKIVEIIIRGVNLPHNGELIKKLEHYKQELKNFVKRRISCLPSTALQGCSDTQKTYLVLKSDEKWMPMEYYVKDLYKLEVQICKILNLKRGDIILHSIKYGCLQVVYRVPEFLVQRGIVFPLSPEQQEALCAIGITALHCHPWEYALVPEGAYIMLYLSDDIFFRTPHTAMYQHSMHGFNYNILE